jgi:outer membrane protein
MKARTVGAMSVLICFAAATVFAELKIGFINSQQIFKEYQATKDAQDKFDKEVAKWEQEATNKQKQLMELKDQLEKQSLLLSAQRKKELEDQFNQKKAEYQAFLSDKLGQNGDVYKRNVELTKPIVEKINKILDKIANDEHYDFVFDAAAGGVVYAQPKYDLTDRVIKILNAEATTTTTTTK